ncbi:TonB-dependent receptor [Novosphingobium sp.]|uniref:TonB-dependent receptor n=1 Tax=Novosphingobium sp. TaxID=1874826 RepID=UPI0025EB999F|nr:TonB-dependent receptor [Novosphingobium sp.]MCC6926867.1 TonB-dependent receptor [Novosphingobium sp.]
MTRLLCSAALALPLLLCAMPAAAEDDDAAPLTDTIVVTGQRQTPLEEATDPLSGHASLPDAAALTARLPGAALIGNGPISGQVQFRGLFSDRLAIRVGGQSFQTGGPNAMDPPLHYAPAILLDTIKVSRGAAPVSEGPGMGAMVDARLKSVRFGSGTELAPQASLAASYRSADQGYAAGGVAGLASERLRLGVIASWEQGSDYRIPGGHARDTGYERLTYGLSAGFRSQGQTLSLDLRRQETGPSGNPPYAMDIDYFHTDFARLGFDGRIGALPLALELGYVDVRHGMDNFSLRPAPTSAAQYRYSYAEAQTMTARARIGIGPLALGADLAQVDRTVTISNPNNPAFFIASLDRIEQSRLGLFAEARFDRAGWQADLGLRIDWHRAQMANPAVGSGVPAMIVNLANQTALGNAPRRDTTWDAVLRVWREDGALRPRLVLSRKSRVPNAVERFSWLPTEASGGLADGNIYIGRQTLRPEVAWAAEAGVDVIVGGVSLRPSLFYRRVDHYIQGGPVPASMPLQIAIATMNGDSTPLIASNVDAELYGFDADLGWQILPQLRFDATVSYVRGQRRDLADNLYRIAPLNGRVALAWQGTGWSLSGELVGAAAQRKVSATNGEAPSSGWVSANLWFGLDLGKTVQLSGGIENLFDRRYADHLAGRNRVPGGDVGLGERLPAAGRSLFVRLGLDF